MSDKEIEDFLETHIPKDCKEYCPSGSDQMFSDFMQEHFQALDREESKLYEENANMRFIG